MSPLHASADTLNRAVGVTERLCSLPAVATSNWADQAADALTGLADRCLCLVLICEADERGRVIGREAAGAAGRGFGGDQASHVLTLRSNAERAAELGFTPGSGGVTGRAEDVMGPSWQRSGLGSVWPEGVVPHVSLCVHPLGRGDGGQGDGGRILVAAIGLADAPRDGGLATAMLSAAAPVLARRALLAVGVKPAGASRWLTSREQAVLERLALGLSVREIADEIGRSPHTVHDHVKSLHRKLNASSRGELVARALGFIDDSHRVLVALGAEAKGGAAGAGASMAAAVRGSDGIVEPKPTPGGVRHRG